MSVFKPGLNGMRLSTFSDDQRQELGVFVSNSMTKAADEIVAAMGATISQFYQTLVDNGCLNPEGVARIQAARDAARQAAANPAPPPSGDPTAPVLFIQ